MRRTNPEPKPDGAEAAIRHMLRVRWNTLRSRAEEARAFVEWPDFEAFLAWARPRFVLGQCIQRIDPKQGFTAANCHFVARSAQMSSTLDMLAARNRARSAERILSSPLRPTPARVAGRVPKPVRCVDLGRVFPSITEAARIAGVAAPTMWAAVNGKSRAAGMRWEYA